MSINIVIVGLGLSGSVLAREFAIAGAQVLVVESRPHIGGNAYDYYDANGLLIHKYGPHIFHTNDGRIMRYLQQFATWRPYEHRVVAAVDGQLLPVPVNARTLEMLYGSLPPGGVEEFIRERRIVLNGTPRNAEESVLTRMGKDLYEKFFKGYTEKQWGREAKELDASVTARIPFRTNYDDRYFTDTYQMMPIGGYTMMFQNMLNHPNIHVLLNTKWQDIRDLHLSDKVIFTGPVDEFFDYTHGPLPYRSLDFVLETHYTERVQSVGTINYPNSYDFTRITEFKYLTGQIHPYTVTVKEYPKAEGDPYYPIPAEDTAELYQKYKKEAEKLPNVRFAGRLGTYRYYNMDQVVGMALHMASQLISSGWV